MRPLLARLLLGAGVLWGALTASGCQSPSKPAPVDTQTRFEAGFQDRTRESGLDRFERVDGSSGRKFFPEQMGSGCAIFDYDNDGFQDVYFCSGSTLPGYKGPAGKNRLFRNKGGGSFEDVTDKAGVGCGKYCIGAAAADYDNDGDTDLYLTCFGPNVLYRNEGDGTFKDVTAAAKVGDPRLSASAAWGDFDGDGFLDLYVANYVKYDIRKDRWCSKFAGQKSFCGPTLYDPGEHTLYHNNGDGAFTDISASSGIRTGHGNGMGVVWLDYDDDGRQDIFVANDQSPNFLWHNEGGGKFVDTAMESGIAFGEEGNARAGMGVDVGDYDNDGKPDLVVTNFSEESNALYHNEGGLFRDVAMASGMGAGTLMFLGFGTGFLDYDRDGHLDLFFANGHVLDDIETYSDSVTWAQAAQLFRNKGDGTFDDASVPTGVSKGKRVARGAAFGDLDNDGRPDVVISVMRGKPLYLHNENVATGHWLGLTLRPKNGAASAIGATVWVTADGKTQRRDVRANASYASSNDPRPLFGLGPATRVTQIKVRWPNGKTSEVVPTQIDEYLTITE